MRNLFLPALLILPLLINGCASTGTTKAQAESPQLASKIYNEGKTALSNGDFETASKHFKSLEIYFPESPYTHQAQMELAYAYFKNGDYDLSISTTENFIHNYPNNENLDYAYYLRGLASFEQSTIGLKDDTPLDDSSAKQISTALQYFTDLESRFPDSKYMADSNKRMTFLKERLARYDVATAKGFIRDENYTSAAARARYVMKNYPDSSVAGEAASIASMADDMLNMNTTAAETTTAQNGDMTTPAGQADNMNKEPAAAMAAGSAPGASTGMAGTGTAGAAITGSISSAAAGMAGKTPAEQADESSPVGGIRREAWLLQQNPENYTIQLLSTSDEKPLLRFVHKHKLEDSVAYYKKQVHGKTWHTLVYGTYPSTNDARAAIKSLPADIRALGPWLQNISSVQQNIRNYSAN